MLRCRTRTRPRTQPPRRRPRCLRSGSTTCPASCPSRWPCPTRGPRPPARRPRRRPPSRGSRSSSAPPSAAPAPVRGAPARSLPVVRVCERQTRKIPLYPMKSFYTDEMSSRFTRSFTTTLRTPGLGARQLVDGRELAPCASLKSKLALHYEKAPRVKKWSGGGETGGLVDRSPGQVAAACAQLDYAATRPGEQARNEIRAASDSGAALHKQIKEAPLLPPPVAGSIELMTSPDDEPRRRGPSSRSPFGRSVSHCTRPALLIKGRPSPL